MFILLLHSALINWQHRALFSTEQNSIISGEVDSFFKQNKYGFYGEILVDSVFDQEFLWGLRPKIRLYSSKYLALGENFTAQVKIKPIFGALNEAGYDAEKDLFSKRILAKAKVTSFSAQRHDAPSLSIRSSLHQRVSDQIKGLTNSRFILALTFADRNLLSDEDWLALKRLGLTHLVAISGLHLSIVFVFVSFIIKSVSIWRGNVSVLERLIPLSCALLFAWLAGFSPPTQRAFLMLSFYVVCRWLCVRVSLFTALGVAMAILLTWDPFLSASLSFWLSFLSVSALLYIASVLPHQWGRWRQALALHLGLSVMMAPVGAAFFSGYSWLSAPVNAFVIPWFSFIVVPLCLVSVFVSAVFPQSMALIFWQISDFSLLPFNYLLRSTNQGWVGVSSLLFELLCLVTFLAFVAIVLNKRVSIVGALFGAFLLIRLPTSSHWTIDLLDVGQGLSILIEKNGHGLLYDTGPSWGAGGAATFYIYPVLVSRGLSALDYLVISHDDLDHAGGEDYLRERYPDAQLLTPRSGTKRITACIAGTYFVWQQLEVEVLWPFSNVDRVNNQNSCVLRIVDKTNGKSVLLTGDIDRGIEQKLLNLYKKNELESTIMLAPHHGSRYSSSFAFINTVSPKYVISGQSKTNPWHHPSDEVKQRYSNINSRWFNSADDGQIHFNIGRKKINVTTQRQMSDTWYRHLLRDEVK